MYNRLVVTPKKGLANIIPRFLSLRKKKGRLKKHANFKYILFGLEKRERFAIQTIILTGGVLITQVIFSDLKFYMVLFLSLISYILTWWSLKEDIEGNEIYLLFILPVLFTASLSLFYFLLPPRWIIRLTTTAMFAVGTYAILLVENIYNVASLRSIQLLRAAQSVGLLITLIIVFLSANIIYSLRLPFWANFLLLTLISFFLALQSLWTINLDKKLGNELIMFSLIVAVGIGEMSMALSFWPITTPSFSLLISASFYTVVGIIQQYLAEKLFSNVIREYIIVFIFTFLLTLVITRWG